MIEVNNKEKYAYLFEDYTHSLPVIYSSLNGQYQGELFVDCEENPQVAILFTPFAFHFVTGNPEIKDVETCVGKMIFKEYLISKYQKEAIFFSPNEVWNNILDKIFNGYNGIKETRNIFSLNKNKFYELRQEIIQDTQVTIKTSVEKDDLSSTEFPISRLYLQDTCVSFCAGFMLGQQHAEINIETLEDFRGKGYAKKVAFDLVNTLLDQDIEPDWCTWPYRKASSKLAEAIGFELKSQIPAHIWVEEECGVLNR